MTRKVVDFKLIIENDPCVFEMAIKRQLLDGWELHGVIDISSIDEGHSVYCTYRQAMVLY